MSLTLSNESTGLSLADLRRGESRTDSGRFDPEAFHAMERRDNALVADDILRGALSGAFTYSFEISGKNVQGVSVIGARHIASKYGALKHRIVASMEKRGARITFQTYPYEKTPMSMNVSFLRELEDEMDFYKVVVELTDLKTGYSLQVEKSENRMEERAARNGGGFYERPNFQIVAQSKAFRNGVLDIVPQDLVQAFKAECIKLGKNTDITTDVMDEKRRAIISYAARVAVPVDRPAVAQLTYEQINGLSEATRQIAEAQKAATTDQARAEVKQRFVDALAALNLAQPSGQVDVQRKDEAPTADATPKTAAGPTPSRKGRATATKESIATTTRDASTATDSDVGDGRPVPPSDGEAITQTIDASQTKTPEERPQTQTQTVQTLDASDSSLFGGME